jgi:hypothetical protein
LTIRKNWIEQQPVDKMDHLMAENDNNKDSQKGHVKPKKKYFKKSVTFEFYNGNLM